jgi:Neuraminidase (sialidase)
MKIEIINSTVVRHSENYYITFPWVATNDNRIYLVYRKAGMNTAKNAKSGSISHHDTDSCIAMIYSEDFGVTWARDEIIIYRSRYGE